MSESQEKQLRVVNIDQAEFMDWGQGERYQAQLGMLAPLVGAEQLGYNVTKLPPGKSAFPYHLHHNNEEMFIVLEGAGKVLLAGDEHTLRQGDIVCCPAGDAGAHKITNNSDAELVYLAISTKRSPEIVEYPDSNKVAAMVGWPMGEMRLRKIFPADADVDYWDGENTD